MNNQRKFFIALAIVVGVMMLVVISNQIVEKEFPTISEKKLAIKKKGLSKEGVSSKPSSKIKKKKLKSKKTVPVKSSLEPSTSFDEK